MEKEYWVNADKEKEIKDLEKFANYYFLMHFWMKNIEDGKCLDTFFDNRGYKRIAVYGMGFLGMHLIEQLSDRIKLIYTVDQGIVRYNGESFPISEFKDAASLADVIVVTPVTDYEYIKKMIMDNFDIDIVSLEEVVLSV